MHGGGRKFVLDDFSPEVNFYTHFTQEKKVNRKVFGKLELCQVLKITSKAQIALYFGVHVTSRGTIFIKNRKKPEDQDLYLGLTESLNLFPDNLIGSVGGRQNFSEMAQIQCILGF